MLKNFKRLIFFVLFIVLVLGTLWLGFRIGNRYVLSQNERFSHYASEQASENFLKPDDQDAIMIFVDYGDTASRLAQKLVEKEVISQPFLFTALSKLNGFDGAYQYGTHFVKKNMPYDEIMFVLTQKPSTKAVLFREGLSYLQIKKTLQNAGVAFDEALMDDIVKNPAKYDFQYDFLKNLSNVDKRDNLLQGYLFPDTYTFDLNTDSRSIIATMLYNMDQKAKEDQFVRAKKIGMTYDQIITLASIIEKEAGNTQEMYKISRVFHNRLAQDMPLQSCATINYLREEEGLDPVFIVSYKDLNRESAYNTYKHTGLPPGPICNPGLEAIRAALYPYTADKNLLFFSATGKGDNVFASNFEGHLKNINQYLVSYAQEKGLQTKVENNEGQIYTEGAELVSVDPH